MKVKVGLAFCGSIEILALTFYFYVPLPRLISLRFALLVQQVRYMVVVLILVLLLTWVLYFLFYVSCGSVEPRDF